MVMVRIPVFFVLSFVLTAGIGFAQVDNAPPVGEPIFLSDTLPDIDVHAVLEEEEPKKKKKVPKKVFYGKKCRKSFTKKGSGKKQQLEQFYYLKRPEDPDFYVPTVYVWDIREGQVIEIAKKEKFDPRFHKILHGPYVRTIGGNVMEQGIFYIGTKHGRWETYAPEKKEEGNGEEVAYNVLLDKKKYYKGWLRETRVVYYDAARKKVKEVWPYENGRLNGTYYMFQENGMLFVKGTYDRGKKVGLWVEYFPDKEKRQREVQYPEDSYQDKEPYVLNEWDEKNNQIIVNGTKVEAGQKVEADPVKNYFKKKGRK